MKVNISISQKTSIENLTDDVVIAQLLHNKCAKNHISSGGNTLHVSSGGNTLLCIM